MLYRYIGEQIRMRRREKNLTQDALAHSVGISLSFLGHIERGTRKLSVDTLYRIARALACSADELLGTRVNLPEYSVRNYLLHALYMLESNENGTNSPME